MRTWLRTHTLGLAMFGAFLLFWLLQAVFGWHTRNEELLRYGRPPDGFWSYLGSGHFGEATFENWESEFLQMGAYVLLTALLVQKGSAESKKPDEDEAVDEGPREHVRPDSPWPVRHGGVALKAYEHSLTIAMFTLFGL